MHGKSRRLLVGLIFLLSATGATSGCGGDDLEDSISRASYPVVCAGQQDKQITTTTVNYLGAQEEVIGYIPPENINHAADAEVLWHSGTTPSNEAFAVAWVGGELTNKKVYVRRYSSNPAIKDFLGLPQLMDDSSSPGWVRRMGFDDACSALYWTGAGTCAWFVWQTDSNVVRYRAINIDGYLGAKKTLFAGLQPSGDRGQQLIGLPPWFSSMLRKTLVAWISVDRSQIRIAQLDYRGEIILSSVKTLETITAPFKAYQTAVVWSGQEKRWLVAWTEHAYGSGQILNGKIYTNYVDFISGQPGPSKNLITHCEGDWDFSGCTAGGDAGIKNNEQCICKGMWLTSSYYATSTDRYRLQQYDKHAILNLDGKREGTPFETCTNLYSPIAEANFLLNGKIHPFQSLNSSYPFTQHYRLEGNSQNCVFAGDIIGDGYTYGQAFRSAGNVAIAVSTNDISNADLKLSIVDVHTGGCPSLAKTPIIVQ